MPPKGEKLSAALDRPFAEPAQPPYRRTRAIVVMKDGRVVEERQPHMRGGAQEPLTRQDVIDKFMLNVSHGGWSKPQADAALKLLAGLYNGRIDLSPLRG